MQDSVGFFIGKVIECFQSIQDYYQILFTDGSILSIYNPVAITNFDQESLNKYQVVSVNTDKESIELLLNRNGSIKVSLLNDDYRGPEAMEYSNPDGPPIVWP